MNNNTKEKKKNWTLLPILIILIVIASAGIAYAKYREAIRGSVTAQIANVVCDMIVQTTTDGAQIVNPHRTIVLRNYGTDDNNIEKTSNVDVQYTVKLSLPSGVTGSLPDYYWVDTSRSGAGAIVAENADLTGVFAHGSKRESEFIVYFPNGVDEQIIKNINFELTAKQSND